MDKLSTIRGNQDQKKSLELIQSNAKLVYENISLKIDLQCLRRDIDSGLYDGKLKNFPQLRQSKSMESITSRSNF